MKEKRYGGGVRKCEKCGELINGSKIHRCNKDYFASVRNKITKSTENSGYTVYIPESAKKDEEKTWQDIFDEWTDNGIQEDNYAINLLNWLKENFKAPKRK